MGSSYRRSRLVVITPAHNEVDTLLPLVRSVDDQQVKPDEWIVVDDRSSDGTGELAERLAVTRPFMKVVRRPSDDLHRNFGHKVAAFEFGCEHAQLEATDLVGVLDADVSLPLDYFAQIINEFDARPALGLAGGRYRLPNGSIGKTGGSSVPGPAAVMRVAAMQHVGGFDPLPNGGEDAVLGYRMRARGWETTCLANLIYNHTRVMGSAGKHWIRANYELGQRDRTLENPGLFQALKLASCVLTGRPIGIAGLARTAGYIHARLFQRSVLDAPTRRYVRQEQMQRVFRWTEGPKGIVHPVFLADQDRRPETWTEHAG